MARRRAFRAPTTRPAARSTSGPSMARPAAAVAADRVRTWCASWPPSTARCDRPSSSTAGIPTARMTRAGSRAPTTATTSTGAWTHDAARAPHAAASGAARPRPRRRRAVTSWVRSICSARGSPRGPGQLARERRYRTRQRRRSDRRPGSVCLWCSRLADRWSALLAQPGHTQPNSGADRRCQGQPDRAERSEPRSGGNQWRRGRNAVRRGRRGLA
jgi:hypothetical protein